MGDLQALSDAIMKIIALVFVNLVPLLLDPNFLSVAISIDSLVLGISVQSLLNKNTEKRLDLTLQEVMHLTKLTLGIVKKEEEEVREKLKPKVVR